MLWSLCKKKKKIKKNQQRIVFTISGFEPKLPFHLTLTLIVWQVLKYNENWKIKKRNEQRDQHSNELNKINSIYVLYIFLFFDVATSLNVYQARSILEIVSEFRLSACVLFHFQFDVFFSLFLCCLQPIIAVVHILEIHTHI